MSWDPHMEVLHYNNISYPYSTAGSFIEYFESLTYQHVNFIFSGASHAQGYEVNHHEPLMDEYVWKTFRKLLHNAEGEDGINNATQDNSIECPRRHLNNSNDYQELLELGEAVGTHSRGLSQEQISSLPVSKYKCGFFLRKKSRDERCVICLMEYKRRDKRITLPCKHVYHASCGNRWLSINKACPICYTEVFAGMPKHK